MRRTIAGLSVVLLVLAACGEGGTQDSLTEQEAPEPEVETVTETVVEEVEVIEEIEVTPQACLDALDAAESAFAVAGTGFELSTQALNAAADGFFAISEYDVVAIDDAADRMDDVTAQLNTEAPKLEAELDEYRAHAGECRG